ncbi:MAG: HlyD family efflux transporter periplasmic adaptor subunit [Alphaproteobacteria bacterium]|nr:HlyD family efflux transporter periplasmic adaptor subunit [Alphaproteobacteria bacterium]
MTLVDNQAGLNDRIVACMGDGAIAVARDGTIMIVNQAAERTFGLAAAETVGRKFGEVFLADENALDFAQSVLDAIYDPGRVHSRIVAYGEGEARRTLSVVTAEIEGTGGGVVAVFADVTDLDRLRETEREMATKLADAYRDLEDKNETLRRAARRQQITRIGATAFVFVLFVGIGAWNWVAPDPGSPPAPAARPVAPNGLRTHRVAAAPLRQAVALQGTVEPLQVVNVVAPFAGVLAEKLFMLGEQVERGQPLAKLGTAEMEKKRRDARSALIKAREALAKVENWEGGSEMARARRSLEQARSSLDTSRARMEETRRLVDLGIVAETELTQNKTQYANDERGYKAAQDEMKSTAANGGPDKLEIARLELTNAEAAMADVEKQLAQAAITAPVAGVVLQPTATGGEKGQEKAAVELGSSVQQGALLLSIGDLEGISLRSTVDEVEVGRLRVGHKAKVTGDAFPGLSLDGEVAHISFQAARGSSGVPSFEVMVKVKALTPEQRKVIRVGMSARARVEVYENQQAVSVPIEAVRLDGEGAWVAVLAPGQTEPVRRLVKAGQTTPTSVEIVEGVAPGDELVLGK